LTGLITGLIVEAVKEGVNGVGKRDLTEVEPKAIITITTILTGLITGLIVEAV